MTSRIPRFELLSLWWITRSLLALAYDRRMTVGLAFQLVDSVRDYRRALSEFREDVAMNRFGSRWVSAPRHSDSTTDES